MSRRDPDDGRRPLRRWAARLAALALGCSLALAAGEMLVRATNLARSGVATDRGGLDRAFQQHDPRVGWRPITGVVASHHTTEFDVEYAINASGYRQSDAPSIARGPGPGGAPLPRVVLLGDSFVFGQGVEEHERFGDLLAVAKGIEVVNMGVPGTGTGQQVLLYEEPLGPHVDADLVVLAYFLESVQRVASTRRFGRPKPRFDLDGHGEPILTGVPVPRRGAEPALDGHADQTARLSVTPEFPLKDLLRRHSAFYSLLRSRWQSRVGPVPGRVRALYPEYAANAPAWRVTRALLARLRDAAAARGARLAVVIIPHPWQLLDEAGAGDQHLVAEACTEAGVPVRDLTPALRAALAPAAGRAARQGIGTLYYPVDGHWTRAGHAVAARELADFLDEYDLLDR